MPENVYAGISDREFIVRYKVELSRSDAGVITGKIRSLAPDSTVEFIEEMLIRKKRLIPLLLADEGKKIVTLWITAAGTIYEDGTRSPIYEVVDASFDGDEALRLVKDSLAKAPKEERGDGVLYLDSYDLILPADDGRDANEIFKDYWLSPSWPYSKDAEDLTIIED